jgi:hypothetical protein
MRTTRPFTRPELRKHVRKVMRKSDPGTKIVIRAHYDSPAYAVRSVKVEVPWRLSIAQAFVSKSPYLLRHRSSGKSDCFVTR